MCSQHTDKQVGRVSLPHLHSTVLGWGWGALVRGLGCHFPRREATNIGLSYTDFVKAVPVTTVGVLLFFFPLRLVIFI